MALARREWLRFIRQPHRVIGALATPLLFWVVIGMGMNRSFTGAGAGVGYLQYFYPGTILMVLLFTAMFSTISVIEDRREGFLQSVMVAPVGRGALVMGKLLGGTLLATGQAILLLPLAYLAGLKPGWVGCIAAVGIMAVLAWGLCALGLAMAWRMTSTQGFHAVMNLLLMPLWFLSGALFPRSNAAAPVGWLMVVNPLSWGLDGLRSALGGLADLKPFAIGATVALLAAGLLTVFCLRVVDGDASPRPRRQKLTEPIQAA
jgi:ABC-2 type transport system permease protein